MTLNIVRLHMDKLKIHSRNEEYKDDSYLETDMKKRRENNEKAVKDMKKTKAHKDMVKAAGKHFGEATAMAKRGLNEPAIRQQIAKNTGGGQAADRATALADRQTYGQSGVNPAARQKLAAKQRGDFRNTTSSNPGLHGYAHKSDDPAVKAKQAARGAQRGSAALTPNEKKQLNMGDESFDTYDLVLEFLYVEGYAETIEEAEQMMVSLTQEQIDEIIANN